MSKRRWGKAGSLWSLGRTTAELAAGRRRWQALMTQATAGMEAGKARLAGDTARSATKDEVRTLKLENRHLKETMGELYAEMQGLKKTMSWGFAFEEDVIS